MKKQIWIPILVVVVIVVGALIFSSQRLATPGEKGPIKIGFTTPLTGNGSDWGVGVKKGAELAYDEIKELNIRGKKIEIIYEDIKCDPKIAVTATQKLINVDKVKLITGEVCSSDTLAVAPLIEDNKVIYLGSGVSNPDITNSGDYIFRIWPSDAFKGKVMAEYIANNNIKKVGIIYINNDFGKGLEKVFKETFENKLHQKVVISESYNPKTKDFRTILAKIKNADIEAVYIVSYPEDTPTLYKQIKEINFNLPIYADGDVFFAEGVMEKLGNNADGVICVQNKVPVSEDFKNKYQAKFGEEGGLLGALGYDSIMVLTKSVQKCNGLNIKCIKDYLYKMSYNGASGKISFDKNGDIVKDSEIYKIENGRTVLLK